MPMECDDAEEAEAWAAMRAAFAEDDAAVGIAFSVKPGVPTADAAEADVAMDDAKAAADDAKPEPAPARKAAAKSGAVKKVAADKAKAVGGSKTQEKVQEKAKEPEIEKAPEESKWLQENVDRLVGEVQRLASGPFSIRLLTQLWSLPLEDQHDVLLGATGSEGDLLETSADRTKRLWSIITDEVEARGGMPAPPPLPGPEHPELPSAVAAKPPTPSTSALAGGGAKVGQPTRGPAPRRVAVASRGRSRSRSPSI